MAELIQFRVPEREYRVELNLSEMDIRIIRTALSKHVDEFPDDLSVRENYHLFNDMIQELKA